MAQEDWVIHDVPLKDIKDVPRSGLNVRLTDRNVAIEDLAASIKKHGLLQPILVRGEFGRPPYELIAGHRRLEAHRLLKEPSIKARFKAAQYDDFKARVESLIENMQRVELNHADTAEAITEMYNRYGKNARKVSDDIGLPLRTVRDYVKIEEQASPYAKKLLKEGKVEKADVKRAIDAAQGNLKKADELLAELPELYGHEKKRAVIYAQAHPDAEAKKILEEAKKARHIPTVIVSIDPAVDKALSKAEKALHMDREEIATKALARWLQENGFLAAT